MSLETQLQEVIDREAIRDLAVKYAHFVSQKNIDGFLSLYADDGVFLSSADPAWPVARGQAELRKLLTGMVADKEIRPFSHNHVVQLLSSDRAIGTSYNRVFGLLRNGAPSLLVGRYDDKYSKIAGSWKFALRDITCEYYGPPSEYRVPSPGVPHTL